MKGEFDSYIANVDKRATEMYNNLVKQLAEKEGITEQRYDSLGTSHEQHLKSCNRNRM